MAVGDSVALGCNVKVAVSRKNGVNVALGIASPYVTVLVGANVLSEAVRVMGGGKGFNFEYGLKKMIPK